MQLDDALIHQLLSCAMSHTFRSVRKTVAYEKVFIMESCYLNVDDMQ